MSSGRKETPIRLLDLFCGAGGASMGYHQAGFDEVVGVDIKKMRDYPFEFHRGDALEFLAEHGSEFDAIHASPPCQHYATLNTGNNANHHDHPDLVSATREGLLATGRPYVIENVPTAPLIDPIVLCGEMFSLAVIRHRKFECSPAIEQPAHIKHRGNTKRRSQGVNYDGPYWGVFGHGGGRDGSIEDWQGAMGIDWITSRKALAQAIPPAYTRYIAEHLLAFIKGEPAPVTR